MSNHDYPSDRERETKPNADHEKKRSAFVEYFAQHKPVAFLIGFLVFSLGGPMSYFGSNPNILYLVPVAVCALILYFSHEYVSSLKSGKKGEVEHSKLDNAASAPLETPLVSNIAAPSHRITENASEIIARINAAGPLQKDDVINSYVNGSIDWKVGFHSLRTIKGDSEHIEAKFAPTTSRPPDHPFIICVVSRREYAYLEKFKPLGPLQVFRLTGVVTDIDPEGASIIKLSNAVATQLDASEKTTVQLNPAPTQAPSETPAGLASRVLTAEQLTAFTGALQEARGQSVGILRTANDKRTLEFTRQVREALKASGITIQTEVGSAGEEQVPTGVAIVIPPTSPGTFSKELVPTLQKAFKAIAVNAPVTDVKLPPLLRHADHPFIVISEWP